MSANDPKRSPEIRNFLRYFSTKKSVTAGRNIAAQLIRLKCWSRNPGVEPAMANIEISQHKLVLKQGSTTLTLDKDAGKATLQQRLLLWNKKPVQFALSDIDDIAVKSDKDAMSGASIHHSVLHRRSGEIAVLTTEEAKDAADTVKVLRDFVGL